MSDILLVRSREAEGLQRMIFWSLGGHLVLVILVALMPSEWRTARAEPESTAMVISLGGPPGPDAGGQNPVAGRAVQVVAPDPKLPFAPAPAPKMPEMTVPEAPAKPAPRPAAKPPAKPAERSSSRKPTAGEEIKAGAARVETGGAAVPFGGLSTGGAGGGGARVSGLENFCCPEYITTMEQMIRRYWNPRQGVAGRVVVKFTIRRDGMLTNVEVTQTSSNFLLDSESRRAILTLQRLPPLPEPYTEPLLTIHLTFEYQR